MFGAVPFQDRNSQVVSLRNDSQVSSSRMVGLRRTFVVLNGRSVKGVGSQRLGVVLSCVVPSTFVIRLRRPSQEDDWYQVLHSPHVSLSDRVCQPSICNLQVWRLVIKSVVQCRVFFQQELEELGLLVCLWSMQQSLGYLATFMKARQVPDLVPKVFIVITSHHIPMVTSAADLQDIKLPSAAVS